MNYMKHKRFKPGFLSVLIIVLVSLLVFSLHNRRIIKSRFIIAHLGEKFLVRPNPPMKTQIQHSYKSTCSSAADRRGFHQNVIAYSLFGNFSHDDVAQYYLKSLQNTIKLVPLLFPGWIVRIYHNLSAGQDSTFPAESFVDLCNATEIIKKLNLGNVFERTWRWFPLLDEMVDTFMSRDSDSRIIPREVDAVFEWLASEQMFHIMRDHPAHCTSILAVKVNDRSQKLRLSTVSDFEVNRRKGLEDTLL